MTPSHPRPLPEAPLVEAWGVRWAGGHMDVTYDEADARQAGGTVVPLIAADRLTDERLREPLRGAVVWARRVPCIECHAEAQEHCIGPTGKVDPHPSRVVDSALAALRTLLEEA